MNDDKIHLDPVEAHRGHLWWILGPIGLFLAGGLLVLLLFGRRTDPIPPEIADDAFLVRGREIYLDACIQCHGPTGHGDGPVAKNLMPRPRNFADDPWKYGEKPEQVLTVLSNGVKDAQMPAFGATYPSKDLKAVAAYLYQIAHKPVPESLRTEP